MSSDRVRQQLNGRVRFWIPLRTWIPQSAGQRYGFLKATRRAASFIPLPVVRTVSSGSPLGLCRWRWFGAVSRVAKAWGRVMVLPATGPYASAGAAPQILLPEDVLAILGKDLAGDATLRIRVGDSGRSVRLFHLLRLDQGTSVYAERWFMRSADGALVVRHQLLTKEPADGPPPGLSAMLMRNSFALYKMIGVTSVEMTAGLASGGALWGRAGFCPQTPEAWDDVRRHIRDEVLAKVSPTERGYIENYISDILDQDAPEAFRELVLIDAKIKMRSIGNNPPKAVPIPTYVLHGSRWDGAFLLPDQWAEDMLDSFIQNAATKGRWQTPLRTVAETVDYWRSRLE